MGRPRDWWRGRPWHREPLPTTLEVMSHAVRDQMAALIRDAAAGRDRVPGSRARIETHRAAIRNAGPWPLAPVGFGDVDGLGLADGHHRLAALQIERDSGDAPCGSATTYGSLYHVRGRIRE